MRRFVVEGRVNGEGRASLLVTAEDAEHAQELAEHGGLEVLGVYDANRAMARQHGVYGANRRRPRAMIVPRGRAS